MDFLSRIKHKSANAIARGYRRYIKSRQLEIGGSLCHSDIAMYILLSN